MTSRELFVALRRVLADLTRDERRVALVGGLAVSVVRANIDLIRVRGFSRNEKLHDKLDSVIAETNG